ncbi:hypothetical protein [uncultured Nostoc sp.]|uniref:hypothetical protein n=1 Tax=uncultured Nostoc sp. TaxID=340711 RepID=UPI00262EC33C|nr:hypothetical protein [uncultured Nostoc sp.]
MWGGHLVRPWLQAIVSPTPQEVIKYFFIWKSLEQVCVRLWSGRERLGVSLMSD